MKINSKKMTTILSVKICNRVDLILSYCG